MWGEVKNAVLPLDTRHPMILPPEHHITRLIIDKAHLDVYHNGAQETLVQIRAKFWITRGRQIVKKQLKGYNVCRKLEGWPMVPPICHSYPNIE